jgi:uncharacterized membrane protein
MRTFWGRVAHSILFEVVLLCICTPVVAMVFDKGVSETGVMTVGVSLAAMIFNGLYNYTFDRILVFLKRPLYPRSFRFRCFHSILFEIILTVATLPMVMWLMDFGFYQALVVDLSFSLFVPVYALVFNWIYDLVFPVTPLEYENA